MAADRSEFANPWLLRQLGIERSEAWLVFCGAACLFAVGWTDVSLANISEVFFLKRVGVEYLPWAFLGSSGLLVVTGVAVARFVSGRDRSRLLPATFAVLAAILLGLWGFFHYVIPEAADWLLLISKQFKTTALIVFWVSLGDLVHGRQAKRLYAPLIAGFTLGSIAGSFASGSIGSQFGLDAVLPITAAVLGLGALASLPLARLIESRLDRGLHAASGASAPAEETADSDVFGVLAMWRENRLFRLLALLVVLGSLVAPMIYYQFQFVANAATQGSGGEEQLLELYSQIRGWLNVAILLVQLKIASLVYRRIGVPLSSTITPLLYIGGFVGLAFSMSLTIGVGAMVATRLSNQALHQPALKVLFNLLPESLRARATAFLDGPLDRFGGVLGNVCVLLALEVGSLAAVSSLALPISLAWGGVAVLIWRAYPQLLLGAAKGKGLAGHDAADPSDFLDRATLRGFAPDLLAEDAGRCTAALGLIADADPALAAPLLFEAASKAGADRRGLLLRELVTTLGRSSEVHDRRLARQVATWIGEHPELRAGERADLLWSASRLCPPENLPSEVEERLRAGLEELDPGVQIVAHAALQRADGDRESLARLDRRLQAAVEGEDALARRAARRELGRLLEGQADDAFDGRLHALACLLADAALRSETAETLAEIARRHGPRAGVVAEAVLVLASDREPRTRAAALRYAGHSGQEDRCEVLIDALGSKAPGVSEAAEEGLLALGPDVAQALLVGHAFGRRSARGAILSVLKQLEVDRQQVEKLFQRQIESLQDGVARLYVLAQDSTDRLVVERLGERLDEGIRAALLFLSVLENDSRIADLEPSLRRGTGQRERSIVVEALESLLSPAEREAILPLLDDISLEGRMRKLAGVARLRVPGLEQARLSLLDDPDELTRNLAVATWPANVDPDGDRARRAYAETFGNMLSPVDIVLLLKSVPLFERLTTRHLMDLASAMHEERFVDAADICREGEIGNCMYLIVEGRVGLRSGSTRLAEMGTRDFFGEMALFDGITRSATVTAEGEVLVLRLDRNDLLNLMDELPAIAIAICQSLSERLREMNRKAAETNPAEVAND